MDIKSLGNNSINLYTRPLANNNPQDTTNTMQAKKNESADKLEISQKARELQQKESAAQDFSKIRSKIDSGYYNTPEVSQQVAEKLYSEIFK